MNGYTSICSPDPLNAGHARPRPTRPAFLAGPRAPFRPLMHAKPSVDLAPSELGRERGAAEGVWAHSSMGVRPIGWPLPMFCAALQPLLSWSAISPSFMTAPEVVSPIVMSEPSVAVPLPKVLADFVELFNLPSMGLQLRRYRLFPLRHPSFGRVCDDAAGLRYLGAFVMALALVVALPGRCMSMSRRR
jgi:hypothetical protein